MSKSYPDGPKFGLETSVGPVIVHMLTAQEAFVICGRYVPGAFYDGQAHINDDVPTVSYRGQEYIGRVRLVRDDAGTWSQREDYPEDRLSRRPQWTNAPVSYQRAIVAAIADALTEYLTTNGTEAISRAAEIANTERNLYRAQRDLETAQEGLTKARATVAAERKHVRTLEARLSTLREDDAS